MQKQRKLILSFVLFALLAVAALTGCQSDIGETPVPTQTQTPEATPSPTPAQSTAPVQDDETSPQSIGTGQKTFVLSVTDDTGTESLWNVSTDEETVGAALVALGLIAGEDSDFGLYIKEVNGLTADYDTDKAYWAFYVNGDYAMSGADSTPIEADTIYGFVYTKD